MTLSVQPAIAIFDTARGEACGVAPVGVADPTFFAPITKVQREAGGVRGVAVNDAGQMVDAAGTVGGVPVEAEFDELTMRLALSALSTPNILTSGVFQTLVLEDIGPVDTPENARATMQDAINLSASLNLVLVTTLKEITVDFSQTSVFIPDNFQCDLTWLNIKRATGNTTPRDMWVNADTVNGNVGLSINRVKFDGQRVADALTNVNPAHRFCGLRLVKCSGFVDQVRADNTVNGEIQEEGVRGGICLDQSVDIHASKLFGAGTDGTAIFVNRGKNYVDGVWANNNTGSGFSSAGADNNDFHHIYSDGSGYSGVSVNGVGMRCSFLASKNSPVNYAGVNIGHDTDGARSTGSQIDNVSVESAAGWGIVVTGSPNVSGINWRATGSAVNNLRVINSPGLTVSYRGDTGGTDTLVSGTGKHFLDAQISGALSNGVATGGSQTKVYLGPQSLISGCGTGGGTTAALNAANNTEIVMRGEAIGNLRYGVISTGGASALVVLAGAKVMTNAAGNIFAGAGVVRYEGAKFSNDAMTGNYTILSGTASLTVTNGNAMSADRIVCQPMNAAARTAGQPIITVSVGVSFTAALAANAAADAQYSFAIL